MIVGAREWFQDGLTRPAAIVDATDRYFEDQDMLGQWLAERCFQRVGAMGRAGELYQSWCEFAVENGEEKGTQKAFAEVIQKRFVRDRVNQLGRIYRGVDLLRNQKTAETR